MTGATTMLITLTTTKKRMMMMMTNMMNVRAVMIGMMVSMAVLAQVMGRCEKKNNKTKAMPMIRMTAHFGAFLCHW